MRQGRCLLLLTAGLMLSAGVCRLVGVTTRTIAVGRGLRARLLRGRLCAGLLGLRGGVDLIARAESGLSAAEAESGLSPGDVSGASRRTGRGSRRSGASQRAALIVSHMAESRRRLHPRSVLIAFGLAAAAAWAVLPGSGTRPATRTGNGHAARTAAMPAVSRRRVRLGDSVQHRPIEALELRGAAPRQTALVVGAIHGDETAGIRVTRVLARSRPLPGVDVWIVLDLNPDGAAAGTRQNARRVDLNRNFPWNWQALGRPGDQQYSGPRALSEPESRIAHRLILRLRPRVTIWFHQPLGITDLSGGDPTTERRFARDSGLPPRRLPRYPGSATTWQNHKLPGSTAFVVELPGGRPSTKAIARYALAVRSTLAGR